MFKRFAFYEKSHIGWQLVVYHDELPSKSINGYDPERVGPFSVPQDMIDVDGTPNMGLIIKAFPNPNIVIEPELEWPIPDWAVSKAPKDKITVMQQLFTNNSALRGNATVAEIIDNLIVVVTDANNWIKYTINELLNAYKLGPYILKEFPNPKSIDYLNDPRKY